MKQQDIEHILKHKAFPDNTEEATLIETHISWVILTDRYVYKIKKPVSFDFLDFHTKELREFYCKEEFRLNSRFSKGVYLGVLPICKKDNSLYIGRCEGEIIDYAVYMKRLKAENHMPALLEQDKVTKRNMAELAHSVAEFHRFARIIPFQRTHVELKAQFDDLLRYISHFEPTEQLILQKSARYLDSFIAKHKALFTWRLKQGWIRDCHGDLHAGNIFLSHPPILFDCIEFNPSLREIDVLNDVAFLCMELEFSGRDDLSQAFLDAYHDELPAMHTPPEKELFLYYKLYRANVRAKVHILQYIQEGNSKIGNEHRRKAHAYVQLIGKYLEEIQAKHHICV